jgi:hypothetical protein
MIASRVYFYIGMVILTMFSGILIWGVWPNPRTQKEIRLQGGELVVTWPGTLRKGDPGEVILALDLDESQVGNHLHKVRPETTYSTTSTTRVDEKTPEAPSILAQARLEFFQDAGVGDETIRQAYQPGQSANFRWNLRPRKSGIYSGTLWLYLQAPSMDNNPNKSESLPVLKPVYSQQLEVEVIDLWKMKGSSARVLGATGGIVAIGLCLGGYFLRKDSLKERMA